MTADSGTQFSRAYLLNYSYSSSIDCLLRAHIGNESHYFLLGLKMTPDKDVEIGDGTGTAGTATVIDSPENLEFIASRDWTLTDKSPLRFDQIDKEWIGKDSSKSFILSVDIEQDTNETVWWAYRLFIEETD